jgi:hypothetical protein
LSAFFESTAKEAKGDPIPIEVIIAELVFAHMLGLIMQEGSVIVIVSKMK